MSSKQDILAATAPPADKSEVGGVAVSIRGLTTGEATQEKSLKDRYYEVIAACITEPKFTEDELRGMKAGSLNQVWDDIIKISTPKKADKKNS